MLEVRIEDRGPNLQTPEGGGLYLLSMGQIRSPDIPQGMPAQHSLTVLLDPLGAFLADSCAPAKARLFIRKRLDIACCGPEEIEVVQFPQQVLHFLELLAPRLMQLWEEIFHRVAETLQTNTQLVKSSLAAVAERLSL